MIAFPWRDAYRHDGAVATLQFASDGETLASSDLNGGVFFGRVTPDSSEVVYEANLGDIDAVAVSREPDPTIAVALGGGDVVVWRLSASDKTSVVPGSGAGATAMTFGDDRRLFVGTDEGAVYKAELDDESPQFRLMSGKHADRVFELIVSPNSRFLTSGSWDSAARIWNLRRTADEPMELSVDAQALSAVAFSPDCRWLYGAGNDGSLGRWDLASGDPTKRFEAFRGHDDRHGRLVIAASPDRRYLLSGDESGRVFLWPLDVAKAGEVYIPLSAHADRVSGVVLGRR